ncbi:hypothetical protein [Amycolatopsis granulosa]|uniref:hypothetical protein n=1 Tax=Amycolatopsis granulosa TaxID=185684 RepID=UPI001421C0FD|nr:hypothetical protein [Amycolatopsis granulosa]NIH84981.1 hypothetical protein [Amycolatopsis granulosa]
MTSGSRHAGGGTLFTEPYLLVGRPAEADGGFAVRDRYGRPLGTVVAAGAGPLRKLLRALTNSARFRPRCFEVRDSGGSVVLKVRSHDSRFLVTRADGTPIGDITRRGRDWFALSAQGRSIGTLEDPGGPGFAITGADGTEVARTSKGGQPGELDESAPGAGEHVVEVLAQLTDPLASLVIAAALTLDPVLRHG